MNKILMLSLLNQFYGDDSEYENLSDEEKSYMNYVDKCLNEANEKFRDACTRAMLLILESSNKLQNGEDLSNEETVLKKEQLLMGFSKEDQDRIELFMYACIQTMGIYSEERIQERRQAKDKTLIKKNEIL